MEQARQAGGRHRQATDGASALEEDHRVATHAQGGTRPCGWLEVRGVGGRGRLLQKEVVREGSAAREGGRGMVARGDGAKLSGWGGR